MSVGDYIKELRISRGYSQEQLGSLLGVQRAAVQKWESGKVQNLKRETIKKLSEIFNVSPSTFIDENINGYSEAIGTNLHPLKISEENEIITIFSKLPTEKKRLVIDLIKNLLDE